jgi:hypothetical protein
MLNDHNIEKINSLTKCITREVDTHFQPQKYHGKLILVINLVDGNIAKKVKMTHDENKMI